MSKQVEIDKHLKALGIFVPCSCERSVVPLNARQWQKDVLLSWLFQTCIRLQSSLDRRFLRFGITVQEARVLLRCVESRSITPGRLAVLLERDKGAITRYTNRLQSSHLPMRVINQRDRRVPLLRPTAEGKRMARDLVVVFNKIREELFAGIVGSDVQRHIMLLAQLYKNAVRIGCQKKRR
jgi:DNA-binding MarR family transcriptional regulator